MDDDDSDYDLDGMPDFGQDNCPIFETAPGWRLMSSNWIPMKGQSFVEMLDRTNKQQDDFDRDLQSVEKEYYDGSFGSFDDPWGSGLPELLRGRDA
jgi:hypothetical protein